jgi:hypothetical protein
MKSRNEFNEMKNVRVISLLIISIKGLDSLDNREFTVYIKAYA